MSCDEGLFQLFRADVLGFPAPLTSALNTTSANPAWSPDGTTIVFERRSLEFGDEFCYELASDIYRMNPDGSGQALLVANASAPDWAPDGSKLVFQRQFDIWTANADGSNPVNLTNGPQAEDEAAWSPDGTKLVFVRDVDPIVSPEEIFVMNADGSQQTRLTTNTAFENSVSWQPLPYQSTPAPTFDHPRLAGPIRFSIVPNFRQTISNSQCPARGGLNSSHGPPLAFASCNPPGFVPGTIAHMGPSSRSWASYGVIYGDTNAGNGDQANVTLRASLNDIRTAGGADYPASLTLVTKLRISDRFNGGSQSDPATVADFDYSTPISCTATAGPEGASCNLDTSADAITAGTIKENKATVVQVFRYRVNDSGANGTRGDADDRIFAVQGIYIP